MRILGRNAKLSQMKSEFYSCIVLRGEYSVSKRYFNTQTVSILYLAHRNFKWFNCNLPTLCRCNALDRKHTWKSANCKPPRLVTMCPSSKDQHCIHWMKSKCGTYPWTITFFHGAHLFPPSTSYIYNPSAIRVYIVECPRLTELYESSFGQSPIVILTSPVCTYVVTDVEIQCGTFDMAWYYCTILITIVFQWNAIIFISKDIGRI